MKTTTRTQKTTYSNFWHVRLLNAGGESPAWPTWIVRMWRAEKVQSQMEIIMEYEAVLKKMEETGIDNGPEGEFANYPLFDAEIIEWNGDIAELS